MKSKTFNVAFYIRLSREDGDNLESESITNQRDLLHIFLEKTEEKLVYIDEYVDDGFTGSNFDRPSWKRLMADIDSGKVNTIITKDLSRMGRDYISMGEYIERIFPRAFVSAVYVVDRMSPADDVKRGLIERLRIDRNARHSRFVHNF